MVPREFILGYFRATLLCGKIGARLRWHPVERHAPRGMSNLNDWAAGYLLAVVAWLLPSESTWRSTLAIPEKVIPSFWAAP